MNYRDELREQQQLSEEIVNAVTSAPLGGEPIDEDDLQDELDQLEQEAVDERMLKTGTVPVADRLESLPAAAKSERTFNLSTLNVAPCMIFPRSLTLTLVLYNSQGQIEGSGRGGRGG